jgi:hypothetical protein
VSTARLSALLLGLLILCVSPAGALARTREFQTPSHQIRCLYSSSGGPGAFVRCDALFLNDVGFFIHRRGRGRREHVTDAAAGPHAAVLRYGRSLVLGPFRCTSRRTGLTCKSRVSGHGFTVSRQQQRVF